MRRTIFMAAMALSVAAFAGADNGERLIDYVNPFVGTDGYGNVYPGVATSSSCEKRER